MASLYEHITDAAPAAAAPRNAGAYISIRVRSSTFALMAERCVSWSHAT